MPLLPPNLIVASPRGPVPDGGGYSWISPETRTSATTDEEVAEVGNLIAGSVLAWLDTLSGFQSLGILGASQGACVAFQTLRAAPHRFDYAINLAGYCLPGSEEGDLELRRTKPPVFWGRGDYDDVIPSNYIHRTKSWLLRHSALTERHYPIGHEFSTAELEAVAAFVVEQISDSP